MFLVNGMAFDAEWKKQYNTDQIHEAEFHPQKGEPKTVEMMYSQESVLIQGDGVKGFVKPYQEGYGFLALLPEQGLTIDAYLEGLSGEGFLKLLEQAEDETVEAGLPKYSARTQLTLNEMLKHMGMPLAFDMELADFSGMGRDPEGKARYACLRGTHGDFKMDVDGSDKRYGFCLPASDQESPFLAVAESPIDALSVATLLKLQGEDFGRNHYLSLGGTAPRALLRFLRDHEAVTHISLCLDNDRAGILGIEKIREAVREDATLSRRIQVIADNPPAAGGKDYNELLCQRAAALRPASRYEERA